MNKTYIITILATSITCSCTTYNPKKTEPKVPARWKAAIQNPIGQSQLQPLPSSQGGWWRIFQDGDLNYYEEIGMSENLTIQDRIWRLADATASYEVAYSSLFPKIDFGGLASRRRLPKDFLPSPETQTTSTTMPVTPFGPAITTTTEATLAQPGKQHISDLLLAPELNYEIDFWGKYLQNSQASLAAAKASEEDIKTASLLVSAAIASHYFEIRSLDVECQVVKQLISLIQKERALFTDRFNSGLDNATKTLESEVSVTSLESDLVRIQGQRRASENALATLLGKAASDFSVPIALNKSFFAPTVPVGLPASIIKRRPDICAKQDLVEQARLLVGVAKTAFYPQITLFGDAGYQSDSASSLFKWKNHILTGTVSLLAPIFDAGKNQANLEGAKARYQEAVVSFLNTALIAFQETEDALTNLDTAAKEAEFNQDKLIAAGTNQDIAIQRFESGLSNYTDTIPFQREYLLAERELILIERKQILGTVQLIKSIGGGWQ